MTLIRAGQNRKNDRKVVGVMLVLFFLIWIIFNGKVTLEITLFGIIISILVFCFICRYMDYSLAKEGKTYRNLFRGIAYVILLVYEIIKANLCVMKLIVSSKYEIEPVVVRFRTDLKGDASKVVLANSITLTPGTITIALKGDEYLVHCLDKDLSGGMEESSFVRHLRKMEGAKGAEP